MENTRKNIELENLKYDSQGLLTTVVQHANSGEVLMVAWVDCDADTLLLKVIPAGPACHTGALSCFFRQMEDKDAG
ncbi:MAG: phosphoribosyl-ATP pyrophosphatase [Chloroflexi bacterium]|nr:phosphoribosyl-ATP pyrophosphatase [Chloroflexota bacterium]